MRREAEMGKINLGNKGLTKLWNLNPDNLGKLVQNLLIFSKLWLPPSWELQVDNTCLQPRYLIPFLVLFSEACKDADRNFLPSLESYFEDAIMEIDPVNKVGP